MSDSLDNLIPLRALRQRVGQSELALAKASGMSRDALRAVEARSDRSRLSTITALADQLDRKIEITAVTEAASPDHSFLASGYKILRDGWSSWRVHLFDAVDEYRRTLDGRLVSLRPPRELDGRLRALTASVVMSLSAEAGIDTPTWAARSHWLPSPWFVSGSDALKAYAILESPLAFRRNNIFVLANFLERV